MHALSLLVLSLTQSNPAPAAEPAPALSRQDVHTAGEVIGLEFTDDELALMLEDVSEQLAGFERLRAGTIDNAIFPATGLGPLVPGVERRAAALPGVPWTLPRATRPADLEELAFADIATLAALIRAREVSCVELTRSFLARLRRLDERLHCVISFTEERALAQAAALDEELARGEWRGPLHGIPWGAKDLLAVRGTRTTWGATPFEEQSLDLDATVVERLDAAGAVLIAKLTLGALAWGDVWFGGMTRNPWNPEQGSSGSSAGSASATAAGGVVFALGSETLGSIVSPSDRCGNSSLRPTFGLVSRHGALALSWSMDKLGPIARSARDAAIVLDAIAGPDGRDPSVVPADFAWPGEVDVEGWRVGLPAGAFGDATDDPGDFDHVRIELENLGVELVPVELPDYPVGEMLIILTAEAAAAFDELTRSGADDELVRQERRAWPNVFRAARLIPAVEYLRAQRLRTELMRDLDRALADVDVLVHPSFASGVLSMTNLTGHPTFVAPCGFRADGTPFSISFTGHLFDEARLLALAHAWQGTTDYHLRHPDLAEAPR